MPLSPEDERAMPPAQRLAVLRAELDGHMAALEGGSHPSRHLGNIKWLAAEIWELEQAAKESRAR